MKSLRKAIVLSALILVSRGIFAQSFSPTAVKLITDFDKTRLELTTFQDKADSVKRIDQFIEERTSDISNLSQEEKCVFDSLVYMEKFTYTVFYAGEGKEHAPVFKNFKNQLKKYAKNPGADKWTHYTYGCIVSYWMAYSIPDILLNGMSVKGMYEDSLKKDPNFSPSYLMLGQWYFYSPVIFGGGKEKAKTYYKKALDTAVSDTDRYLANMYYSQILFELKEYAESSKYLAAAKSYCPNSQYLARVAEYNARGNSMFEMNEEKSTIMKKGSEYKKEKNW